MLEHILHDEHIYAAPDWLKEQANLQDLPGEHARSLKDPDAFWGAWAERFQWFRPWDKVMDWQYPDHKWFVGGQTNITLNAHDRHADGPNRTKLAMIWIAEDGSERKSPTTNCAGWCRDWRAGCARWASPRATAW